MNNFELLEQSGRTVFSQKLIENGSSAITFTDHFDPVDILWSKNGVDYVGELKCRMKYASTDLSSGMIMKHKYIDVCKYAREPNRVPYYIMMFNDNTGYMWRLDTMKINWIMKDLEKTNYGNKTVFKQYCALLDFKDGHKFSFSVTTPDNDIS